jgi:SagB-type dehydrogenase family enzyme
MDTDLRCYLSPTGVAEEDNDLTESFHEATKWSPSMSPVVDSRIILHLHDARAVLEDSRNQKRYANRPLEPLVKSDLRDPSIKRIETQRRSCRSFDGSRMEAPTVSAMLSALRATRRAQSVVHPDALLHFRAYPSGGALYPVETYFALPTPDRSEWVLHHHAPIEHAQTVLGRVPAAAMAAAMQDSQGLCDGAGMIVMLSAILRRTMTKYGPTGYRFALIEAGAMVQQLVLTAADIGLGALVWGSAYDDRANRLFDLDGVDETMLVSLFVGGAAE